VEKPNSVIVYGYNKSALMVCFRKLLGDDFVAKLLAFDELMLAADNKLFRQMSNTQHCLYIIIIIIKCKKLSFCNNV